MSRSLKMVMLSLLVTLLWTTDTAPAYAFTLADVASRLNPIRSIAHSIGDGLSGGVREQAHRFIKEDVEPLLSRVDAIIAGNIQTAADEAMRILDQAERSMKEIIDFANGRITERIDQFFNRLHTETSSVLAGVDRILTNTLCSVAPYQRGIYVSGIPFTDRPDRIRVWWPADTQCFAKYAQSSQNPLYADFTGWEYYEGTMCEVELDMQALDPADNMTIPRMSSYYRQLAGLASEAICFDRITRNDLIARRLRYEEMASFYDKLARGMSPLSRGKENPQRSTKQ